METLRKNAEAPMSDASDDPWVSIPQAAAALGISNHTVSKLALRRELRTQVVNNRIFVHRDSIAEYLAKRDGKASQ